MDRLIPFVLAVALLAGALPARAERPPVPVKVERNRPDREKLPMLRFLKENRHFLRGRLDALRQEALDADGDAVLGPRFLELQALLAGLAAARDSLAAADANLTGRDLLAKVEELLALEAELDELASLLADQEDRLVRIHHDFLEHQETTLLVLVRGRPAGEGPFALELEDEYEDAVDVAFTAPQARSLSEGGTARAFHGFVEPRLQTWALSVGGQQFYVTLEPEIDELTCLLLDLEGVGGEDGGEPRAEAWVERADLSAFRNGEAGER